MIKSIAICGVLVAVSTLVSLCTNNPDDTRDSHRKAGDREHKSGPDESINITTTFIDDNDSARKVSGMYSFKTDSSQCIRLNEDGTYKIFIKRSGDAEQSMSRSAWVEFDYNASTKAITNKSVGHFWDDKGPYNDYIYYYGNASPPPVINITVNSIDMFTGDISLTVFASADTSYTSYDGRNNGGLPNPVPNPGKPVSTEFTFTGKLQVLLLR